jgi:hypothetical protein
MFVVSTNKLSLSNFLELVKYYFKKMSPVR